VEEAGARLEEFYKEYATVVLWEAYKMLGDWATAEDVAQEAFLMYGNKLATGQPILHPKAFVLRTAYYLGLEHLKGIPAAELPSEDVDRGGSPEQDLLALLPAPADGGSHDAAWESLVFWGRRALAAVLEQMPAGQREKQRERLRVLLATSGRTQALQRLRKAGDAWEKGAVSMALGRYSRRVDRCFEEALQAGPDSGMEPQHWSLLKKLAEIVPASGPAKSPTRNLLQWAIRHVNRMPPAERQLLVFQIFYGGRTSKRSQS
jgi:DNA-directed RNA polymerase specialized sigma24 family protein